MTSIKLKPKEESLIQRLRKRAEIRMQIPSRKSVQEGKPDRISELLLEAANELEKQEEVIGGLDDIVDRLEIRLDEERTKRVLNT